MSQIMSFSAILDLMATIVVPVPGWGAGAEKTCRNNHGMQFRAYATAEVIGQNGAS
jgi:hypothetical protein